jgi:hypothetical protein
MIGYEKKKQRKMAKRRRGSSTGCVYVNKIAMFQPKAIKASVNAMMVIMIYKLLVVCCKLVRVLVCKVVVVVCKILWIWNWIWNRI